MRVRHLAIASAATAAIIGLAGCGPQSDSTSASTPAAGGAGATTATATKTTAPASATEEFADAAAKLGDQPAKLKIQSIGGITMNGAIDAQNHKAELHTDMASAGSMDTRQVGNDLYVKVTGQLASVIGGQAGKWMHIDTTKVPSKSPLNVANNDPKATAKMLATSTSVTKTGDHTFSGKVDMTKSPTIKSNAAVAQSGILAKLKAVPFTAQTDDQDRLVKLTIDMSSISPAAGSMTTEYSDFGAPVDVQKPPASQTIEMPAKFKQVMGA